MRAAFVPEQGRMSFLCLTRGTVRSWARHEGVGVVVASRSPAVAEGTPVLTVPLGRDGGCFAENQVVHAGQVVALALGADLRAGYDRCRADAVDEARERWTVGLFGYPKRTGDSPFPVERAFRRSLSMERSSGSCSRATDER